MINPFIIIGIIVSAITAIVVYIKSKKVPGGISLETKCSAFKKEMKESLNKDPAHVLLFLKNNYKDFKGWDGCDLSEELDAMQGGLTLGLPIGLAGLKSTLIKAYEDKSIISLRELSKMFETTLEIIPYAFHYTSNIPTEMLNKFNRETDILKNIVETVKKMTTYDENIILQLLKDNFGVEIPQKEMSESFILFGNRKSLNRKMLYGLSI